MHVQLLLSRPDVSHCQFPADSLHVGHTFLHHRSREFFKSTMDAEADEIGLTAAYGAKPPMQVPEYVETYVTR